MFLFVSLEKALSTEAVGQNMFDENVCMLKCLAIHIGQGPDKLFEPFPATKISLTILLLPFFK